MILWDILTLRKLFKSPFLPSLSYTAFMIALLTGPLLRLYFFDTGTVPIIAASSVLILSLVLHRISSSIPKIPKIILHILLILLAGLMIIFTCVGGFFTLIAASDK